MLLPVFTPWDNIITRQSEPLKVMISCMTVPCSRRKLPVYDMVVAVTGLDMARKKKGRMDRATAGYAYVGGACVRNSRLSKISSVALVEDSGAYSGVVVTAHEIGHLLGSVHDGDAAPSYLRSSPGAKACPWKDGYMMSDLRRTTRGLQWSDCSVKQMRHFLRTSTASCLYNKPRVSKYPLMGTSSLPGKGLSLNAQCQADQGTNACFQDSRVCTQLFCYYNKRGSCYATRPAAEGSSCGKGKHCRSGKCVRINSWYSSKQTTRKPKAVKGKAKKSQAIKTSSTSIKNRVVRRTNNLSVKKTSHSSIKEATLTNRWSKTSINATDKTAKTVRRKFGKSQRTGKQHEVVKSTVSPVEKCTDTFALMGSLSCDQLYKRYHYHYCKRNQTVRKKCCASFRKYCSSVPR